MEPRTGSCLCGGVRYEVRGRLGDAVNCHCRYCRRAHGAPFVTVAPLRADALHWLGGSELVREYATQGRGHRVFCSRCGTRLFNRPRKFPGTISLVVATLDEELERGPVAHINVESRSPTYEIRDDLPRFDALPK